ERPQHLARTLQNVEEFGNEGRPGKRTAARRRGAKDSFFLDSGPPADKVIYVHQNLSRLPLPLSFSPMRRIRVGVFAPSRAEFRARRRRPRLGTVQACVRQAPGVSGRSLPCLAFVSGAPFWEGLMARLRLWVKPRGFTLIELLVVIAIIAILIGLL